MNLELFQKFYDEHENVQVRFVGFSTDDVRYDFGIVYTNMFFGKPLIVCMQTGRSALLDSSDVRDYEYLQSTFKIATRKEAEDLASFFEEAIPYTTYKTQYE
ncbi:DUF3055 domain-containing protein [Bacillus taeanensis]|uniref:DUF3055 domain-containing protein n=1 Tax=Bacillus taeanensis TaxID=273032 RepID=A0A366XVU5_9BACI|nr:DUF3055 domain-containing protein [Bacillus taeanensis]RBW70017.1 hypothetical protein DS031_09205 [Bacillus taeanensis]